MRGHAKQVRRALALLMALAILCSFLCVFPLYRYPGHTCSEHHCVLCAVAMAVDAMLHQSLALFGLSLPLFAFCAALCLLRLRQRSRVCPCQTPITLKTKILG